ncbi:MAG: glycosyltransferase family 2 protein [Gemmatimonadaceae bacterium]
MSNVVPELPLSELPLVSVVIPAFNASRYLGAAIESVLAQSLRNLEVIVVDDGSSDDTAAEARRYAALDPRVRVHVRSEPSGKPAIARNDGIRLARGTMIALLDADDIAVPTRFEDELQAMLANNAGVAFADFHKFEGAPPQSSLGLGFLEDAQFVPRASLHLQRTNVQDVFLCRAGFVEYMLADAIAVNVQTVMFRRDLLGENEQWFDESYVGGEDVDLFFRLAKRTTLVFINAVHAWMRVHPMSLTARETLQCMADAAEVRRINLGRLQPLLDDRQVDRARATVAEWFLAVGYSQWRGGNRADARAAFTTAWNLHPTTKALLSYARAFLPHWPSVGRLKTA